MVLVSDHGETLDELITRYDYAFDHGEFLYSWELQIPLLIRIPWIKALKNKMDHTNPVSIIDVMPTILDALAIEPADYMAGQSLLGSLRGEDTPSKPVFSERRVFETLPKPFLAGEGYSVIQDNRHLIVSAAKDNELYDLKKDPREISNLIGTENNTVLNKKLMQWVRQLRPMFGPATTETDKNALERLKSLGYTQ